MFNKFLFITLLFIMIPVAVQAHKANFFAYVENGEVICEGGFPGGKACRECPIIIKDAASGQELKRIASDNRGVVRFPLDETLKKAKFGLKLVLSGGEGHQAEWLLDPEEYLGTEAAVATSKPAQSMQVEQQAQAEKRVEAAASECELESMIAEVLEKHIGPMLDAKLEAKLGPIRRELAKGQDEGPSFVSIFGGLGWIIGIAGIVVWFRSRNGY